MYAPEVIKGGPTGALFFSVAPDDGKLPKWKEA